MNGIGDYGYGTACRMNSIGRTNIVFLSAPVGPNKKLTLIKIVQNMAPYCDIHSFELIALYVYYIAV